jgi:hypothetical protein
LGFLFVDKHTPKPTTRNSRAAYPVAAHTGPAFVSELQLTQPTLASK